MFNKSLTLNDNQMRTLNVDAYTECYIMKIPFQVERDDVDAMFTLSFPSEEAYEDFMAYIFKPYLQGDIE